MRVVITGAASGIGRAIALRCVADAAQRGTPSELLLVDVAEERLEAVSRELSGAGARTTTLVADLSRPDAGQLVGDVAQENFDGVDAFMSNAGILTSSPLLTMALEDYDRVFAVNTRATLLLAQALHPLLASAHGAIVATASLSSEQPTPPLGAYSASKAALVMLIRQLAYEWGPDGIRCNCVSPGTVHTPMTDSMYSDPARRAERASHIPLRRVAEPEDMAAAISFLAGPDARYVTGVNLVVDGGLQNGLMPAIRGIKPQV
jgi:glucose 1-dehydrogenase